MIISISMNDYDNMFIISRSINSMIPCPQVASLLSGDTAGQAAGIQFRTFMIVITNAFYDS